MFDVCKKTKGATILMRYITWHVASAAGQVVSLSPPPARQTGSGI